MTAKDQNRWMDENYPLYVFFTRRFLDKYSSLPPDEVRSAVNMGFTLALQRHDPARGKISTLIAIMIHSEISHMMQSKKYKKRDGVTVPIDQKVSFDHKKRITLAEIIPDDVDIEHLVTESMDAQIAMSELNEGQKRVLYEHFWLGYSYTEIAKMRGVSASSVRKRVLGALETCKRTLRKRGRTA